MSRYDKDTLLSDWRQRALSFQQEIGNAVIGLDHAIRQITLAIFSRGHVMLEGDVGVGKTTLLRAVARGLGGAYERIEGTIDLMPNDLIYHTYINEVGRPQVDPGPILKNGEQLSVFFFNEVNRARPQVHSLLLRVMAERSITAFNREYFFPHLLVFADRNRVEKEETFEIPSAARDRFLMELHIETPQDPAMQRALMFDPRFHDTDRLIEDVQPGVLPYRDIADIARVIQVEIKASDALQQYALDLWQATRRPQDYGIKMDGVDMRQLVLAGASPRGMSMMMRAARVSAWLNDRTSLIPEDIRQVFVDTTAHRVFFNPVYELRRSDLVGELMSGILQRVAAP
ncbi:MULTISPECIES: AAA family ATPase [Methylocaldum]|jgi:MoxR-like ATPase|uniref:AAA family ATPase n=1 Tax=unclassified Methylocaldum TaxID=2622260 RepID=UPI000989C1DA|nr:MULTISPECIES: MoxR family ATPase [unclassified Methylocaldum]MBP1148494.1 MoxR-like ATPase [Methylocaldum sp. RMAD-M]MVF21997.1 MoxR family ATPase [Methylocaldum sp. BRCS4]